jgi:hypothetical protein
VAGEPRTAIALAGRLVDPPEREKPRFPLVHVPVVTDRVRSAFARLKPDVVVSSAAAGADLIAIGIAEERGLQPYIILPFDVDQFEASSVDRPGDWKPRYREAIARAQRAGRLEILDPPAATNDEAYVAVTDLIFARAAELAGGPAGVVAIAIWEGSARDDSDLTWRLLHIAQQAGAAHESILTTLD